MTEPIFKHLLHEADRAAEDALGRLEHDTERGWDAFRSHLPHRHYHHPDASATPAPEAPAMSLISTVEDDLRNAGVEIGDDVHGILSRHLGLANIAAHVAEGLQAYQADPLVQLAENALGLSPALKAVASGMLGKLVTDLQGIPGVTTTETPAAPAEPAPADPAMGEQPEPAPAA